LESSGSLESLSRFRPANRLYEWGAKAAVALVVLGGPSAWAALGGLAETFRRLPNLIAP
jgi:hypothetical protein